MDIRAFFSKGAAAPKREGGNGGTEAKPKRRRLRKGGDGADSDDEATAAMETEAAPAAVRVPELSEASGRLSPNLEAGADASPTSNLLQDLSDRLRSSVLGQLLPGASAEQQHEIESGLAQHARDLRA